MITKFGDNLQALFYPKVDEDWASFCSWYSVHKNLPNAKCTVCFRRKQDVTPFQMFQWAKRLGIPVYGISTPDVWKNLLIALIECRKNYDMPILIIPSFCMVMEPVKINQKGLIWDKEGFGYCDWNLSQLIRVYEHYLIHQQNDFAHEEKIYVEAKAEKKPSSLVSYKKGCGKWIHTKQGCPFSSAGGLIDELMTVNEQRIIDLWRDMVPLYSSIS